MSETEFVTAEVAQVSLSEAQKYDVLLLNSQGLKVYQIAEAVGITVDEVLDILVENILPMEEPTLDDLGMSDGRYEVDGGPRVLLFDIETAPSISYHWGRWKINVGVKQVISRPYVITWAAKWLGSPEVMSDMLPFYLDHFQANPKCDLQIVQTLWRLLDEADIVIGHFVKRFDVPQMNARFAIHGMAPPSPYKMICTKEMASKNFKFEGNSLAELADHLGVGNKIDTNFDTWKNCVEGFGTVDGWNTMLTYNEKDVTVLEDVYLRLRAFDTKHPNVSLYYGDSEVRCTVCGSTNIVELEKPVYTQVSEFKSFRCECGHVSRARKNQRTKEEMAATLINVAL